ncbi:erythrocyte membrane protein 1 [Plasmodium falciparum IGH-CR14]|uniref:Erythrocyte membrane protein 1 n=1 Tax=Plasmodium falciparum IGH-CR14 TaxID=580059 RepID=A0A0L1I8J0_PLAFA|nr:erythrocyte membrane protein 1 [Plasmodium falciparum IGH-CR14]
MFYTLGDYRDILIGKDVCSSNDMQKIKSNIDNVFTNSSRQHSIGDKNGNEERAKWWTDNANRIWNGMICALSYDTEKQNVIEGVYEKLTTDTTYKYNDVTISCGPSNGTTLSDFSCRPTFFRWLEEWADEFCRKKKHKLDIIENECRGKNGVEKNCSGDGFECKEMCPCKDGSFETLKCPSCANSCRSYRKWINKKKEEFDKQDKIYKNEIEDAKLNYHDNGFCKTLKEKYSTLTEFLSSLKGPCCKTNTVDTSINFKDTKETFKHATNCNPCSEFKINCRNGKCIGGTQNECNGKTVITVDDIKKMRNSTDDVSMLVSDDNTNGFEGDGLRDACGSAGIFEGIRKDVWTCGEVCGVDICSLKKKDNNGEEGDEHIIIKELLKRWLEYFLEDYNKINKKLKPCINNSDGSKCIKDYDKKFKCIDEWIKLKQQEWEKIKKDYLDKYKSEDSDTSNMVKSFLGQKPFYNEILKAIKPCKELNDFESKQCNVTANSGSGNPEKKDIVQCFLEKLKDKINKCKAQHDKNSVENGGKSCTPLDNTTLEEEPIEEEDPEKKIGQRPSFCPDMKEPKKENDEEVGTCGETDEKKKPKAEGEGSGSVDGPAEPAADSSPSSESSEETDKQKPVPKPPSQPQPPPQVDENPFNNPHVKTALMSSTIMWSIGIGFAAFTYFYLKKKPKSPVDLLRVLDIHKGDYDIPTQKSPNKYIPYASQRYKGKTYIYMEGDTSGDEDKYIGNISSSDITSSESEYEEMDINDIYPYTSPKYKTLIEVVLEPTKRDTFNTPSADTPTNKFTDEEWNQLKDDFISQYLPNTEPNNNYRSGNSPTNTNNTTTSHDNMGEKPFIMSIHDRNLYTGEEISYNINMSTNTNNDIPKYVSNNVYSGIDLINDTLSGNKHIDIYDEVLKRKENELYGTNYKKNTSNNSVAKNTNNDPIMNQLDLLHKWLDRHRDMCEKWNTKEELLDKLNEQWNKDNNSGDIPNDNKTLNTDVSIQIDIDENKGKKEFSNMDTILDDMEDDIYYDVNDNDDDNDQPSVYDIPMDHNKVDVDVPKKVHIEMKILNNTSNGSLEQQFPISDVWNI